MKLDRAEEILSNFEKLNILVIGDIGIDKYTQGEVKRISPEAPVPILNVDKEWDKLGLAANVAENLATLKVKVSMMGLAGDDESLEVLNHLFEKSSIENLTLIEQKRKTTVKQRVLAGNQQICRVDFEDTFPTKQTQELLAKLEKSLDKYDGIILQDYGKGYLTKESLELILKLLNSKNKFIAIDPSVTKELSDYKGATLFKPNFKEATFFTRALGQHEVSIKDLQGNLGAKFFSMTKGSEGMFVRSDSEISQVKTFSREVFDVSGAGDTALAVLTCSLISGASLVESASLANLASGVVVGKVGTATVNQEEILEYLKVNL